MRLCRKTLCPITLLILSFVITSCSGTADKLKGEAKYPSGYDRTTTGDDIYGERESVFGKDGFSLFGNKDKKGEDNGIGINAYLWRAALDTVSFMPLASADPFGGVIITDWYTDPAKPSERFKVNVFIKDKELKSNGVSVKVFRQIQKGGKWVDSTVSDNTGTKMEDAILMRAREIRVAERGDE